MTDSWRHRVRRCSRDLSATVTAVIVTGVVPQAVAPFLAVMVGSRRLVP